MAFVPITYILPQYDRTLYKNYWLKAFTQGTVTPIPGGMATDSTGATAATRIELNSEGFPIVVGGAFINIHIDGDYDLWLFPTAAEADANDTTNALQFADDLSIEKTISSVLTDSELSKTLFDGVANMKTGTLISGDTFTFVAGQLITSGASDWRVTSTSGTDKVVLTGGLFAIPLNGVWVDDFIPDRTVNVTSSFDEAILLGRKMRITDGDYLVNDIAIKSETEIEGPLNAFMVCDTAGAAVFLANTNAGDITTVKLTGFSAKTSSQQLGCAFYRQTSMSNYTAYAQFNDIETFLDFETTYDIYPIFTTWTRGRDGFSGNIPAAQKHQCLRCIPVDFAQAKTTNFNTIDRLFTFNADHPDGSMTIQQGFNWSFRGAHWEKHETRALHFLGVIGVSLDDCWLESNLADDQIFASVTTGINAQGTRPVHVSNCNVNMQRTALRFITFGSGSRGSVVGTAFTFLNTVGVTMTNGVDLIESYDVQAVSGTEITPFLDSFSSNRTNMKISESEMLAGNINSPESQNINMFPIGPADLGAANFSVVGFTGKTDVATTLGGAGQAIQVTVSGGGDAIWFTIPAKLRDFLEGKTVTWSLLGFGDVTANPTAGNTAVWESVTPTFSNPTASGTGLTTNQAQLQQGTLTHTIGTSLTSLHFGFKIGGITGAPPLVFEAMSLQLGEIKSEGLSLV